MDPLYLQHSYSETAIDYRVISFANLLLKFCIEVFFFFFISTCAALGYSSISKISEFKTLVCHSKLWSVRSSGKEIFLDLLVILF